MRKLTIAALVSSFPLTAVFAAEPEKHPPQEALQSATPEMKNPQGTEALHPPQAAMDEATTTVEVGNANAATGASSGETGSGPVEAQVAPFPDWDKRVPGETLKLE